MEETKMRKFICLALALIFTITLGAGILTIMTQPVNAASSEADGHLDWDRTDKVWRCVGTPKDCAKSQDV